MLTGEQIAIWHTRTQPDATFAEVLNEFVLSFKTWCRADDRLHELYAKAEVYIYLSILAHRFKSKYNFFVLDMFEKTHLNPEVLSAAAKCMAAYAIKKRTRTPRQQVPGVKITLEGPSARKKKGTYKRREKGTKCQKLKS